MSDVLVLNERYKLIKRVGSGGMASVYRAEDLLLGRVVAVKMLHEGLESDEMFVRQFQREAHSAANLSHPNIVTVHDIGRHEHRSYIVMEFVDGRTLKDIIRTHTRQGQVISIKRVLDLIIQVCQGIGYAHRTGLVHCDVKPQNVIVTADDRVKVADFGIARAMSQASMHHSDLVWGTPQYFSPEQASGETPTPASDVYSIGIILFEMLSNRLPFEGESSTAIALKHLQEPPPDIHNFNPHVPDQLVRILNKVLSKEPTGRYRTAGQLGRILSAYREQSNELTMLSPAIPRDQSNLPSGFPIRADGEPAYSESLFPPEPEPEPEPESEEEITQAPPPLPEQPIDIEPAAELDPTIYKENSAPTLAPLPEPAAPAPGRDPLAVVLGIIAAIAMLGLIPAWVTAFLANYPLP